MTPKRRVLNVLSKSELLEAGTISGIDLAQRSTVDQLCEALAKSKRATLDVILPTLSRDTLKAACLALGLVSEGREKQELIDRILSSVGTKMPNSRPLAAKEVPQAFLPTFDGPVAAPEEPVAPAPQARPKQASDNEISIEVQPRKPRLAWQGMWRVPAVTPVMTQVVEIVRAGRSQDRGAELGLDTRVANQREAGEVPNRLIWTNDNLIALKTLLEERDERTRDFKYRGKVDLVYIDPPFMVNNDFRADNAIDIELDDGEGVQARKEPSLIEILAYKDTWRQGLDSFLSMLRQRLVLLKELLAPTGSIYVHLDWHAVHYVKVMMDELFGYENFVSQIEWKRASAHANATASYASVVDHILAYRMSDATHWSPTFEALSPSLVASHYGNLDAKTGRRYALRDLTAAMARASGSQIYEWQGMRPKSTRCWAYTKENMDRLYAEGRIQFEPGKMPRLKLYLGDGQGNPVSNLWLDFPPVNSQAAERLGYPTQKPLPLLERIITASCPPGGLVLDCFLGSGTTAEAAERLGRRWIGIDNGKYGVHLARKRLIQLDGQPRPAEKAQHDYVECDHCGNIERKERSQKSPGVYRVRPFTLENMGAYQRAEAWQDYQLKRSRYRDEMIRVFGGEPTNTSPLLHGKKGSRWVHVGPLDAPVSEGQIWNIARDAAKTSLKSVDVLSADFVALSGPDKAAIQQKTGIHVTVRVIPAAAIEEVIRRLRMQRQNVEIPLESMAIPAFYAPLAISLSHEVDGRVARVTLDQCEVDIESFLASQRPAIDPVLPGMSAAARKKADKLQADWDERRNELEGWLKKATSWQKFVDFWAVDFNYGHRIAADGKPVFESDWQTFRTRRGKGELEPLSFTAEVRYPEPGSYQVAARVTDVFGNDGIATVTVTVS